MSDPLNKEGLSNGDWYWIQISNAESLERLKDLGVRLFHDKNLDEPFTRDDRLMEKLRERYRWRLQKLRGK